MDIFDAVSGLTAGTNSQANLVNAALSLLGGSGGLGGLVQNFQSQGLGDLIATWVGTGPNQAISPDQIHQVLGSERLSQFASSAGVAPDVAGSTLASMLPGLIDKLTPNGQLPAGNQLPGLETLMQLLK
jgi:uncharacterized protein YidB (DUF937 family)